MSEAESQDPSPEDLTTEELADSIASNESFSEVVRRMARRIRAGEREGRY
ncbi:MAG: hypothetical protein U5J98_06810 [Halobacteriales archaeon]|nr:hypothetical protein [Halobacteriales archaeon]